ncbi:MAG: hypothetical protein E6H78_11795 [Betaproteobacteria bacterium]|nr:MAG: hypothetical protein E6H78_11795 [Betaproteobacteria bacterium]
MLPVLAAAVVYVGLALGATSDAWARSSILLLPAMLIGFLLVGLVLLPLWSVLSHTTLRIRPLFVFLGSAIWVLLCAALVGLGLIDRSGGLESTTSLLIPGLVLVMTFGLLMDPRRVRGGEKATSKK